SKQYCRKTAEGSSLEVSIEEDGAGAGASVAPAGTEPPCAVMIVARPSIEPRAIARRLMSLQLRELPILSKRGIDYRPSAGPRQAERRAGLDGRSGGASSRRAAGTPSGSSPRPARLHRRAEPDGT